MSPRRTILPIILLALLVAACQPVMPETPQAEGVAGTAVLPSPGPQAIVAEADALAASGSVQKAIGAYDLAIMQDPEMAPAYYGRGAAYAMLGDTAAAISDFDTAIRLNPNDADAFLERGKAYYASNDVAAAVADLTEAVRLNPDLVEAHLKLAAAQMNLGDFDAALQSADAAAQLDPDSADPYLVRGTITLAQGDTDGALAEYARAIEVAPDSAEPYLARGFAHFRRGDVEAALQDFSDAIRVEPENAMAYYSRGLVHGVSNDIDAAIADLEAALALVEPDSELAQEIAKGIEDLKQYGADAFSAGAGEEMDPAVVALLDEGQTYAGAGDLASALDAFTQAVELDPANPAPRTYRGAAHILNAEFAAGVRDCVDALRLVNDDLSPVQLCIDLMGMLASPDFTENDAALANYDAALAADSEDAPAQLFRGFARRNAGDLEGAVADWEQATALDPVLQSVMMLLWLVAYSQPADVDAAVAELESMLAAATPGSLVEYLAQNELATLRGGE